MPEIDGIEAMHQIREMDSYYAADGEAKIIVLTADAIRGARESLLAKGFDEYLGKPVNLKQLERLLLRYIPEDKVTVSELAVEEAAPEEIAYLEESLPKVDVSIGLENCGGKISDYLNILKINYNYGNKNLEELEELFNKKDYENYTIKVHAIKSTTRGIGALNISDMALKQEEAGRAGTYEYIEENFDGLRTEYLEHLHGLEGVLRHYGMLAEVEPEEEKETLDAQMIGNILTNIRNRVDSFEFAEVFEILEDVKKYRLPGELGELFAQLEDSMDDLEVEKVRELIENALKQIS